MRQPCRLIVSKMSQHFLMNELTSQQIQAVSLLVEGLTNTQVALRVDVWTRTLQRWLKQKAFVDAISGLRAHVASESPNATKHDTFVVLNKKNVVSEDNRDISYDISKFFSFERQFQLIKQECDYLDMALVSILPQVQEGNLRAIGTLLKISERRSQLMGLNAPKEEILNSALVLVQHGIMPFEAVDVINKYYVLVKDRLRKLQPGYTSFIEDD